MQPDNYISEVKPMLSWQEVDQAVSYLVEVKDNVTEQLLFSHETSDVSATITVALPLSTYRWQVVAKDSEGNQLSTQEAVFVVSDVKPVYPLEGRNGIALYRQYKQQQDEVSRQIKRLHTQTKGVLSTVSGLNSWLEANLTLKAFHQQVIASVPGLPQNFTDLTLLLQNVDATISEIEARDMEF